MGISSEASKFHVTAIHRAPELIPETIKLINQEWPRSIGHRMWSLKASKDGLPTCLVLTKPKTANSDNPNPEIVLTDNDSDQTPKKKKEPTVLAHVKLTPIPSIPTACFIESVVVWKSLRGQGYGSLMMAEAERFCKDTLKLDELYLSTIDKEDFYKKLGYVSCAPVSIFGGPCNGSFNHVTKKLYLKKVLNKSSDNEQC